MHPLSYFDITQRDGNWDKDWEWKMLKGQQCFPQSALETGQGFGRCCQEMLCQDGSSSAFFSVWTNLAPLCSVSYLATALPQCGPLPQARIKLGYPRLNSLWKNHLGVIPVWSPSTLPHIASLAVNITQSSLCTGDVWKRVMGRVYGMQRSRAPGLL